jgi:hypothetical protein
VDTGNLEYGGNDPVELAVCRMGISQELHRHNRNINDPLQNGYPGLAARAGKVTAAADCCMNQCLPS